MSRPLSLVTAQCSLRTTRVSLSFLLVILLTIPLHSARATLVVKAMFEDCEVSRSTVHVALGSLNRMNA